MDQQELITATGVLRNQSASLDLQKQIVDSNNQIINSNNQVLHSNNLLRAAQQEANDKVLAAQKEATDKLLAAQKEAEKKAILGKFTDLLMEGVASDYEDPVFRKKVGVLLSSAAASAYKGAVLEQIANVAPSLFPIWIDSYKDIPVQESYGDLSDHPVAIARRHYSWGFKKIQKDKKLEFEWSKKGAELGDSISMINLSDGYMDGSYGNEVNYLESEKWSKLLAEAGESWGVINHARLYSEGLGRKKDVHKAKEILLSGLKQIDEDVSRRDMSLELIKLEDAWTDGGEDEHYSAYKGCFLDNNFKDEYVWDVVDIEKYVSFHRDYLDKLKERRSDLTGVLNYLSIALPDFPDSKHRDSLLAKVNSIKAEEASSKAKEASIKAEEETRVALAKAEENRMKDIDEREKKKKDFTVILIVVAGLGLIVWLLAR